MGHCDWFSSLPLSVLGYLVPSRRLAQRHQACSSTRIRSSREGPVPASCLLSFPRIYRERERERKLETYVYSGGVLITGFIDNILFTFSAKEGMCCYSASAPVSFVRVDLCDFIA